MGFFRQLCFCLPFVGLDSDQGVIKRRSVCSFALIFLFASFIQLAASVVIWYISYDSNQTTVNAISGNFQSQLLSSSQYQVSIELYRPVWAADRVNHMLQRSYRYICDDNVLFANEVAFWADLTNVFIRYDPSINAVGIGCANGHTAHVQSGVDDQHPGLTYDYIDSTSNPSNQNSFYYENSSFVAPSVFDHSQATYVPTSYRWVTPAYLNLSNYIPEQRSWYTSTDGQPLSSPTWSVITQLGRASNVAVAFAVSEAGSLTDLSNTNTSQRNYVALASASLTPRVTGVLQSLPIGQSGRAYVLDANLTVLAISRTSNNSFIRNLPINQYNQTYVFLNAIAPSVQNWWYSPNTNQSDPNVTLVAPIKAQGNAYHLHVGTVQVTNAKFLLVLLTKDSEFDGGLAHQVLLTGIYTGVICFAALLAMWLITLAINRPISRVIRFMHEMSTAEDEAGDENPDNDGSVAKLTAKMKRLRAKWQHQLSEPLLDSDQDDDDNEFEASRNSSTNTNNGISNSRHHSSMHSSNGSPPVRHRTPLSQHGTLAAAALGAAAVHNKHGTTVELQHVQPNSQSVSPQLANDGLSPAPGSSSLGSHSHHSLTVSPHDSPPKPQQRTVTQQFIRSMRRTRRKIRRQYRKLTTACKPVSNALAINELAMMSSAFDNMLGQLIESQQKLESAQTAKQQFLRYVFHECRVPLNAVTLGIEQLKDINHSVETATPQQLHDAAEESADLLEILASQTSIVARILNDVLSLQRLESAQLELEMQPFSLQTFVLSTMQSFASEFNKKLLNVAIVLDDKPYEIAVSGVAQKPSEGLKQQMNRHKVIGDSLRLRQVLANFLSNAYKFIKDNGTIQVVLTITPNHNPSGVLVQTVNRSVGGLLAQHQHDGSRSPSAISEAEAAPPKVTFSDVTQPDRYGQWVNATISVVDNGIGVSAEDQVSLFQPYRQINAQELQQGKGSGLGLSIAKRLIAMHGGTVGCKSMQNVRTEFFFSVPLLQLSSEVTNTLSDPHRSPVAGRRTTHHSRRPSQNGSYNEANDDDDDIVDRPAGHLSTSHKAAILLGEVAGLEAIGSVAKQRSSSRRSQSGSHTHQASTSPVHSPTSAKAAAVHQTLTSLTALSLADANANANADAAAVKVGGEFVTPPTQNRQSIILSTSSLMNSPAGIQSTPPSLLKPSISAPIVGKPAATGKRAKRLLIAEDSAPNRKLLVNMLRRIGYDVDSVEDGKECVDVFVNHLACMRAYSEPQNITPDGMFRALPKSQHSSPSTSLNQLTGKPIALSAIYNTASGSSRMSSPKLPPNGLNGEVDYQSVAPLPINDMKQRVITDDRDTFPFDLILMDGQMPRMNGFDATRELRAMGVHIPIIAVTGNALEEDRNLFLEAGADAVLTKPLVVEFLKKTLIKFLPVD